MGSLATFKTAYTAPGVTAVNTGNREQLAGLIAAIELRVAEGATVANARAQVSNNRAEIITARAQQTSNPLQGALVSDFYALDAA